MNKVKKLFVLVLIVAVISLGFTGCKQESDHPSKGADSNEAPAKKAPAGDHPAGDHPTGENPK